MSISSDSDTNSPYVGTAGQPEFLSGAVIDTFPRTLPALGGVLGASIAHPPPSPKGCRSKIFFANGGTKHLVHRQPSTISVDGTDGYLHWIQKLKRLETFHWPI